MEIKDIKEEFELYFAEVIEYINAQYDKIRSGRVNPNIFNDITVDAYGAITPLKHVASIQVVDARTVFIKPFDKNLINEISSSLIKSNLGVNPVPDIDYVKLSFPPMTEDGRRANVKKCKEILEQAKIKVRGIREELRNNVKTQEGVSEDLIVLLNNEIDKITKEKNLILEQMFNKKQEELLKI